MTKFLLTGGSGFIAAQILKQLLEQGHTVVTTVRSEAKAAPIRKAYANHVSSGKLEVKLVPDINAPGAFDEVVSSPNIEVVLHTASPFHFNFDDPQTELVDPAINGTTGIIKAVHASCPTVRRVVVTSSFASIVNVAKLDDPGTVFSEKDWNPSSREDMYQSKAAAYLVSKTLAERAAWQFVEDNKDTVKFDLATICPPMVFGPLANHVEKLDGEINTSNEGIVDLAKGRWKEQGIPPSDVKLWVDVRDVATAHIKAATVPEAGGERFLTAAGYYCNDDMVEIVRKRFPSLESKVPAQGTSGDALPPKDKICGYDSSKATNILGIEWIPLEKCIVDAVKSFNEVEDLGI